MLPVPLSAARGPAPLPETALFWMLRGQLSVRCRGLELRAGAGQALWIPRGAEVSVACGPGAVVLPIPGLALAQRSRPCRVTIDPAWEPWLLWAFGRALGYLDSPGDLGPVSAMLSAAVEPDGWLPPMPQSPEALAIAQRILREPASFESVGQQAQRAGWSVRTLQRRFETETGHSLGEWVRAVRVAVALDELTAGQRDHLWIAHHIGYATLSGFARMIKAQTGATPGEWQRRGPDSQPPEVGVVAVPPLPPLRTWPRVNGAHVAVWVARGSAEITIGQTVHRVRQGQALILPAGLRNQITTPAGSLVLPIGFRSGGECAVGTPIAPATFDPSDEIALLEACVASYIPLRAKGASAAGFDAVLAGSQRLPAPRPLVARLASAVASSPEQDRSVADWARTLEVPEAELRRCLHEETGLTFAQWLRLSRMTRARTQLQNGQPASLVARALGYAHAPAFTRAFRAVHGTPPQQHLGSEGRRSTMTALAG